MSKIAIRTQAMVLTRTDFGEADRILTLLTPEHGKLRLMAKGVRRVKSKLAGGIELFSVSDISFLRGRGEIGTLVSSQLVEHFGTIVQDLDRVQLGYALIKQLNKTTEDDVEPEYFHLLRQALVALNDRTVSGELIQTWFTAQILRLGGHMPNLLTDTNGDKLSVDAHYSFDFDAVSFTAQPPGNYGVDSIKTVRLLFSPTNPLTLSKISGIDAQIMTVRPIVQMLQSSYTIL